MWKLKIDDNTIVPSYTGKKITHLLPLALLLVLHTHNNTDGNKLMIFSGIASYYGDNLYIKSRIFYYKSCENPYQYCKSCENPYQVLQVT